MSKRVLLLSLFVILILPASALAVEDCASIPWGKSIASVEQMTFSHTVDGVQYYTVTKTEPCSVFNIEGANVTYGFLRGKLYTVLVEIEKSRDVKQVVTTLMDTYGLPDHKKETGWDVYRWETKDLKIKLKSNYTTDRIKIGMYYKPLMDN